MSRSLGVGLSALGHNPLRTVLSTSGVVIGVAALVAVLAIGDGVEQFARDQIERTTDLQAIGVEPVTSRLVDRQRVPRDDFPVFTPADVEALAARLPEGTIVDLNVMGSALFKQADGEDRAVLVTGCLPALAQMTDAELEAGRFLQDGDGDVAVISRPLADAAGLSLGDRLELQDTAVEIVGILAAVERDGFLRAFVPLDRQKTMILPGGGPRAPRLAVKLPGVEEVPAAQQTIEAWLGQRVGQWDGRVRVASNQARVRQARQGMLIFKTLMGAITGISLLVGGIGIMNVLLASVAERTREIGIRRATGARARDIRFQFLAESVAITGTGSLLGIALGWGGAFAVTALMRAKTDALIYASATLGSLVVAVAAAMLVGLVFGLYPALRASSLSPIDAIRHE